MHPRMHSRLPVLLTHCTEIMVEGLARRAWGLCGFVTTHGCRAPVCVKREIPGWRDRDSKEDLLTKMKSGDLVAEGPGLAGVGPASHGLPWGQRSPSPSGLLLPSVCKEVGALV